MDWGFLTLALMGAAYVWMRVAQLRREDSRLAREREGYRQQIAQDPRNAGAYEALGDSLRNLGHLQEAQDAYLGAAAAAGGGSISQRIEYKLRQLDLDKHEQSGQAKPTLDLFFCRQCGGANAPTRRTCETCGGTLPYDHFLDALRDKEVLRASAESAACVIVLIAALAVFAAQPLEVKGVLIISTVAVVAWRLLQAITGPRN